MKIFYSLLVLYFNFFSHSLWADSSNPEATRGNITVVSSEFGIGENIKNYAVSNAIDENSKTAWVFEKNVTRFKEVTGLFFVFKLPIEIDGISLINGYAKSDSLYKLNSSVKTFKIILPDNKIYNYQCENTKEFQDFKFTIQKVKWMIFIVTSERKGTKYNDLCISEISPTFKSEKLIYSQPKFIISNNGAQYESDILINLQNQNQFHTEQLNFGCGAQGPIIVKDSILIYSDECNDNSHIETIYLNEMVNKTIKKKQLDSYSLIDAISEKIFIVKHNESEKILKFNSDSNEFTPTDYSIKEGGFPYWRWSERIYSDLTKTYKKIE